MRCKAEALLAKLAATFAEDGAMRAVLSMCRSRMSWLIHNAGRSVLPPRGGRGRTDSRPRAPGYPRGQREGRINPGALKVSTGTAEREPQLMA